MNDFPDIAPGRPLWLITLADLALLLVGFLVLVQAAGHNGRALADGFREGFGVHHAAVPQPAPMPVAAASIADFAPGSARIMSDTAGVIAWARNALRDPRVSLTVTGSADGSAVDVDQATGSAALLAADRARAVAALIAGFAPGRIIIATSTAPGRRAATVTLAFSGDPRPRRPS